MVGPFPNGFFHCQPCGYCTGSKRAFNKHTKNCEAFKNHLSKDKPKGK